MARRRILLMVVIVAAIAAIACAVWLLVPRAGPPAAMPSGIPSDAFEITVERVHDGDTLRAHVDVPNEIVTDAASTRIRLLGLDTPEISPDIECWGDEARQRLAGLAPEGSTLWAVPDAEVLDRYGRHLLYLWTTDGVFINAELLAAGDARVMIFAPNDHHEELFRTLETRAAAAGLGQWGACD